MNNNKKALKSIVFSMVLAAGMLLPVSSFAQEGAKGGMFGLGNWFESSELFHANDPEELGDGLFMRDGNSNNWSSLNGTLVGAEQEDPTNAPLGSGIAVLVAAGAGYALLKRKEEAK